MEIAAQQGLPHHYIVHSNPSCVDEFHGIRTMRIQPQQRKINFVNRVQLKNFPGLLRQVETASGNWKGDWDWDWS